ncbi:hypothetical protein [Paenarthrobacter sp. YJN-5]|uniref:hypothetical protein n=1 Tax=Paenarthrobacter sp. YJN-5 TaxID=2735316 RepID=UPI00187861C6|nr:hypothetical protein [Paenarthrobacter sp. YJN-5]QOT19731.1 hypothetical protein HMI59_24020 [Paenarthrobacter sp. YJN-5]
MTVSFRRRTAGAVVKGFETVSFGPWFDVEGCAVKYGVAESEQQSATRDEVLHSAVVYGPPMDEPLTEFDEARLPNDPDVYAVDGRPVSWPRPFAGGVVGTEIRLKRVAG